MSRFKENWQWGRKRKIGRNRRTSLHLECLEDRTLLSTIGIVAENKLTGAPASQWDISGAGDLGIQGFAADISVNQGQTVSLKINDTNRDPYRIDIYRMGYYQGNGARLVTTVNPSSTQLQNAENQPAPLTDQTTGLLDAGNWKDSGSWAVPANATSGIYFAKVVDTRTGGASHIFFIVRDDTDHSQILYQTSDSTWEAYNDYGGNSLYAGTALSSDGRAYKVSYNRPFNTRGDSAHDFVFNAEYPMVRWLEANGYDVSYFTDVDADRYGSPTGLAPIKNHQIFMSNGHDEYWSGGQRANVQAARDAGTNLAFFSGNEIFWKTRWESSIDGSGTPYRTLVCYKETHANAVIDPSDPPTWTGTWRDPRFSPPADGGRPENALAGTIFMVNDGATTAIKVPAADGKMRFWRNTSIATLSPGSTATLTSGTLGYEWDEDLDNGSRPAGLFDMSTTTYNGAPVLQDYGSNYASGTATHHLTLYRAPSGALVFGAGTVQWSWGLDGHHDGGTTTPNLSMQQATVNLFADMGVQPATLQSGLTVATASTDKTPPTSTITAPAAGTNVQSGTPVTITGTATDTGGGVVGGVEVSVDNGTTWHPATGRGSWSYTWTPGGSSGPVTIKSRAVDDSGNLETPGAGITVTVQGGQNNPSGTSIFIATATPVTAADPDTSSTELGVKFRSDVAGYITAIRYYKASTNTGTHVGSLWSGTGTLLAQATFANETASGWQQVTFSSPVQIAPNTTYVASYHAPNGHYAEDDNYFASSGVNSAPLHALAAGVDGPDGVYAYGASSTFPTNNYLSANYWVDVVFSGSQPGTVATSTTLVSSANPSASGQAVTFTATVGPVAPATGTPTGTVTFKDGSTTLGSGTLSGGTATFTTSALAVGTHSITAAYGGDGSFAASTSAALSQVVNQAATSTTLVSSANPSASGQAVTFTATVGPVAPATGTPTGTVTFKDGSTTLGTGTLSGGAATFTTSALAVGTHSITAVYGGDASFAASTSAALSQVVNQALAATSTTLAASPNPSASGQAVTFTATVGPVAPATGTPTGTVTFKDGSTTLGTGTLSGGAATFTTSALAVGTHSITAAYGGDASFAASTSAALSQVVNQAAVGPGPFSIFSPSATPGVASDPDSSATEVGVKFYSDVNGFITGIRFYKGAGNTGTHIGNLWTAGGTLLATATFANETASGWQQVLFATPVAITANTVYVASYFAPNGHYADDVGYFASAGVDSPPLHALRNGVNGVNGVYRYGSRSGFPTSGYQSSNYWVNVVFSTTGT